MNLDYSDDQTRLKAEGRRFVEAKRPPSRVREVRIDKDVAFKDLPTAR